MVLGITGKVVMFNTLQRCWEGWPYLKKELSRMLSVKTGGLWAAPSSYYVICTGRCNLRCTYCPQTPSRTANAIELPRETMLRLVRETKQLSGSGYNISVSGGEPLVYKPIYEAMELAHQLGVNFGITTNGLLLTPANIKRVVGANPFNINISLESVIPEVNEQMRPTAGATAIALRAIDNLLAEKARAGARFGVFIKPTITEINYRSLPQMIRHFGKDGQVQVNPQNFYWVAGGEQFWIKDADNFSAVIEELISLKKEGYSLMPSPEALRGMVDYFRNPPRANNELPGTVPAKNCTIGYRSLFINPDGRTFFCEPLGIIGNINEASLPSLWRGSEARRKRRAALKCRIDCQMTCRRSVSLATKAKIFLRMAR